MAVATSTEPVWAAGGQIGPEQTLGARVVETIEAARALVPMPWLEDTRVQRLGASHLDAELNDAAMLLRRVAGALAAATDDAGSGTRGLLALRLQALRIEIQELLCDIQGRLIDGYRAGISGVRAGLERLSGAETVDQVLARAAEEICHSCGVDRCCIFSTEGARLNVRKVLFTGDRAFQEEWEAYARAHPAELKHQDREVHALRRRVPIMIDDTANLAGMQELISAGRATSYVAAPILMRGSVVGMIHADRYFSGARVDPVVRDCLGAFSAGLGYALERSTLIEGTRSHLTQLQTAIGGIEHTMETMLDAHQSILGLAPATPAAPAPGDEPDSRPDSRLMEVLTRRELEVMELMARGASNGDIAAQLVISEGTVKSHVKHILRKLRAANRAQAVSTYMRARLPRRYDG